MENLNILQTQWLRFNDQRIFIQDEASVTLIREEVRKLAGKIKLSQETTAQALIVASELAHNQLQHARGGEMLAELSQVDGVACLEVLAADRGGGITDPASALTSGQFGRESLGKGLQAIWNLSHELEADIRLGEGTQLRARFFADQGPAHKIEAAILGRPYPGEITSGDQAIFIRNDDGFRAGLADGVGHGLLAGEGSRKIMQMMQQHPDYDLSTLLYRADEQLQQCRGSMLGVCDYISGSSELRFSGMGDIEGQICHLRHSKQFTTVNHTLGGKVQRPWQPLEETVPIVPGTVLAMWSDGLRTAASLAGNLPMLRKPAISIAQYLMEQFARNNDDAMVLVVKFGRN
jgi:anti-sigma regulatory factor (Ser/Thr protein kinase)